MAKKKKEKEQKEAKEAREAKPQEEKTLGAERTAKAKNKKAKPPTEETMANLAELFAVFGDTTRIRILFALFEREINVGGLAELLSMTQSAVSHQLRILKQSHLVASRREGKSMFYFLADDHVRTIIAQGLEHVSE